MRRVLYSLLLVVMCAAAASVNAATIARPAKTFGGTTFINGVVPDASDFNGDADTIYADYNGNITNANIASAAAIAGSKISPAWTTNPSITASGACQSWIDSSQSADAKRWDICINSGAYTLVTKNDAGTIQNTWLSIARATGSTTLNGHLLFTDATYDIGASGATRPRNLYLSGGVKSGAWNGTAVADSYLAITSQGLLENVGLSATVAANNLTIALKGADGNDPSATNVVRLGFRNATLTTGTPVMRNVTAATSLAISSGTTLGTTNGVAYRLWIVALDNAGTVELGIYNSQAANSLLGINENALNSSSTPGNSAQTLYSTSARTNVAVRILGYIEITEATAGTWATAPTVIQVMGPGIPRTNAIIQTFYGSTSTQVSNSTSTDADTGLTVSIPPSSAVNRVRVTLHQGGIAKSSANANSAVVLSLRDGNNTLIAMIEAQLLLTGTALTLRGSASFVYIDAPATTTSKTYKTRFNNAANAAAVLVQESSELSTIVVEEIFP